MTNYVKILSAILIGILITGSIVLTSFDLAFAEVEVKKLNVNVKDLKIQKLENSNLLRINLKIFNGNDEEFSFFEKNFDLLDSKGRQYVPTSGDDLRDRGESISRGICDTRWLYITLNPGLSTELEICFEIPKSNFQYDSILIYEYQWGKKSQTPKIVPLISNSVEDDSQQGQTSQPESTPESDPETPEEPKPELVGTSSPRVTVKEAGIPKWIKTNAGWWAEGQIDDDTFVAAIKFLITEDVLKIPSTIASDNSSKEIPGWIKNTVGWWATSKIKDSEFVSAIQYLIENGILKITDDKIRCSGSALCITERVRRIVDGDTIYAGDYTIRLSLTNTPETNEPGGSQAKSFTANLCPLGTEIVIDQDDLQPYDVYDRVLGKVYCRGQVLNSELLYNDHAEILTQYCSTSEFAEEYWAKKFGC